MTYDPEFERLWKVWPNHVAKLPAFKAWKKHVSEDIREKLIDHVIERTRFDAQWQKGYVPHLATFINQARWEDDYKRVASARYHPRYTEPEKELPAWQQKGFNSAEDYERVRDGARDRALEELRMRGVLH